MKTNFKHISSLFLALLVLVSTQSYSISSHYCGSILVDKAIMKPAEKCAMHDANSHTNHHEHEKQKDNCCDDEIEWIEGQDELQLQILEIEFPHTLLLAAWIFTFQLENSVQAKAQISFYESPPILSLRDFQYLFQVFLI